jgi:hypothetical protein
MLDKATQSASIFLEDSTSLCKGSRTEYEEPWQQEAKVRKKDKKDDDATTTT